jgi:hypothetical protein
MSVYVNKSTGSKIYLKQITAFDMRFSHDSEEDVCIFSITPDELKKYWIKSDLQTIEACTD